jgi:hypothetical protein
MAGASVESSATYAPLPSSEAAERLAQTMSSLSVSPVDPFGSVPVLSRTSAELYLFDIDADMFVIQEKDVQVDIASNEEYDSANLMRRTLMTSLADCPAPVHAIHLGADQCGIKSSLRYGQ